MGSAQAIATPHAAPDRTRGAQIIRR